ncbi:hypothetical protein IMZ31_24205 (plasmid) [Pontibacillus sp. ALD_SL1]|uniref:hypothetical protein n=1 Tax=Pontibacillus sp. ALD_SL1 TaxID=2777185 RepID=UPI001A975FE2|nr:hypothetical protein [Pontibacillus sp. ALD_SL1]QST02556.1 hypothetical protein IMZ31_24205 [Pontibacillus sp. ALD_SL1]
MKSTRGRLLLVKAKDLRMFGLFLTVLLCYIAFRDSVFSILLSGVISGLYTHRMLMKHLKKLSNDHFLRLMEMEADSLEEINETWKAEHRAFKRKSVVYLITVLIIILPLPLLLSYDVTLFPSDASLAFFYFLILATFHRFDKGIRYEKLREKAIFNKAEAS